MLRIFFIFSSFMLVSILLVTLGRDPGVCGGQHLDQELLPAGADAVVIAAGQEGLGCYLISIKSFS
jgi:hypothetical protein